MMRHRITAAALIVPLALTAACSSSSPKNSTSSSGTGAGASSSGSAKDGTAVVEGKRIYNAVTALTSTAITIDAGGLIATTTGHIKLAAGKAVGSDLTIGTGTAATHVIIVGDTAYAALPKGQNTSGKPYVEVSATSKNEFVRGLYTSVQILQAASSLGDLVGLLGTATNFVVVAPNQHYSFDIAGDSKGSALQQQLAELSSKPVPVDLYVNAQSVPVKIVLNLNLGGSTLPITATLSDFNAPLTITAPPANQVAAG